MPTATTQEHLAAAYALGVEHAKNAASWVIDGNASREHITKLLAMIDVGDPALDQYLPNVPDLSGEWAGPTPGSLAQDIVGDYPSDEIEATHGEGFLDKLCEQYENGVSETFQPECERILREALGMSGVVSVWSSYGHHFLNTGEVETGSDAQLVSCLRCGSLYRLQPDADDPSHGRYEASNGDAPLECPGPGAVEHGLPGERHCHEHQGSDEPCEHETRHCNCMFCA